MKLVPFFNDAGHVVFMGGVLVPAGDTRLVDARLLADVEAPVSAGLDAEAVLISKPCCMATWVRLWPNCRS